MGTKVDQYVLLLRGAVIVEYLGRVDHFFAGSIIEMWTELRGKHVLVVAHGRCFRLFFVVGELGKNK